MHFCLTITTTHSLPPSSRALSTVFFLGMVHKTINMAQRHDFSLSNFSAEIPYCQSGSPQRAASQVSGSDDSQEKVIKDRPHCMIPMLRTKFSDSLRRHALFPTFTIIVFHIQLYLLEITTFWFGSGVFF